jgi:hypothetical protein
MERREIMELEDFWNEIDKEPKERRRRWGHVANYPAVLVEQLIKNDALTVQERMELIEFYRHSQEGTSE